MSEAFTTAAEVWIDPSWLSWEPSWGSKDTVPNNGIIRLYEIHQHACDRLASDPNELDRVDAIMALKRVVARRVGALRETYQLRELSIGPKPKYDLELLESFGIIRPFMLKRLIEIRNLVEHQDSSPPSTDECLMFADLVWYFLRSTDELIGARPGSIVFLPRGVSISSRSNYHPRISLDFRGPFSEPKIAAWLPPTLITYEPKANWIKVVSAELNIYPRPDTTFWMSISGKLRGTDEQMKLVYDTYFRISHLAFES